MNLLLPFIISLIIASIFLTSTKRMTNEVTFEATGTLKSASIILIMILHFSQHISRDEFLNWYMWSGGTLVGVFFFVSGYGDITSFERRKTMSAKKLVCKIVMLLLITWISTLMSIILSITHGATYSLLQILSFLLIPRNPSLNPLPDGVHWFLLAYIFISVATYICTKYFQQYLIMLTAITCIYMYSCIAMGFPSFWYNSILCFITGCFFAKYRQPIFSLCDTKLADIAIIALLSIYIALYIQQGKYPQSDIVPPVIFTMFLTVFLSRYTIHAPFISWINPLTYDIYMWHVTFFYLLMPLGLWNTSAFFAWSAIAIASSYICHTAVTALLNLHLKRIGLSFHKTTV